APANSLAHRRHLHACPTRRSSDLDLSSHDYLRYASPGDVLHLSSRDETVVLDLDSRYRVNSAIALLGAVHAGAGIALQPCWMVRSEEHTSELQSRENLVCRLLLDR